MMLNWKLVNVDYKRTEIIEYSFIACEVYVSHWSVLV